MTRCRPHCPYCDSTNVKADAFAEWDNEKQEWVLSDTYDNKFCSDCERDIKAAVWKDEKGNLVD